MGFTFQINSVYKSMLENYKVILDATEFDYDEIVRRIIM
jgi:hypothetical protein